MLMLQRPLTMTSALELAELIKPVNCYAFFMSFYSPFLPSFRDATRMLATRRIKPSGYGRYTSAPPATPSIVYQEGRTYFTQEEGRAVIQKIASLLR